MNLKTLCYEKEARCEGYMSYDAFSMQCPEKTNLAMKADQQMSGAEVKSRD